MLLRNIFQTMIWERWEAAKLQDVQYMLLQSRLVLFVVVIPVFIGPSLNQRKKPRDETRYNTF